MTKIPHQLEIAFSDKYNLKRISRKEAAKFPPITPREHRALEQVWRTALAEARHPHRRPPPYADPHPAAEPGNIADRASHASRPHPESHERTRRSQAYWTSTRKCEACPGPNRRRGKYPFGQGLNAGHTPDGEIT